MTSPAATAAWADRVAPVERPASEARTTYDRIAPLFDYTEAPFERRARAAGLCLLDPRRGERILEIGFGTGHTLSAVHRRVGRDGAAIGADLSRRMAEVTRRRFRRSGLRRPQLVQADARCLPLPSASVDGAIMTFVLELMATPDIPVVLGECRRVLRPEGRLVVVSLDLPPAPNPAVRAYLAAHRRLPRLVDCRPLPICEVMTDSGFAISGRWSGSILGLPVAGACARPVGIRGAYGPSPVDTPSP